MAGGAVHLLLTPPQPQDVPRLIISLGRRYVQYINKTYRRTGTLWDSRCKSSRVQADRYLLLCQRYIELNPVRAARVDDPAHYRWSSYRANALGQEDARVTPHLLYTDIVVDETIRPEATGRCFAMHLMRGRCQTSAWHWANANHWETPGLWTPSSK